MLQPHFLLMVVSPPPRCAAKNSSQKIKTGKQHCCSIKASIYREPWNGRGGRLQSPPAGSDKKIACGWFSVFFYPIVCVVEFSGLSQMLPRRAPYRVLMGRGTVLPGPGHYLFVCPKIRRLENRVYPALGPELGIRIRSIRTFFYCSGNNKGIC
jgi:hypothetical protein